MDKRKVIETISAYLARELSEIVPGSEESDSFSKENEKQAAELHRLLTVYRFLPVRDYDAQDVACPGALVELELNGIVSFYFISPQGGGFITTVEGQPVQVITPASPLGEVLLGKREGETFKIEIGNSLRCYKVLSIR